MGEKLLGKRVLIVEDEALLALELELAFSDNGAEIVGQSQMCAHASSAYLGIRSVMNNAPAAKVSDLTSS